MYYYYYFVVSTTNTKNIADVASAAVDVVVVVSHTKQSKVCVGRKESVREEEREREGGEPRLVHAYSKCSPNTSRG